MVYSRSSFLLFLNAIILFSCSPDPAAKIVPANIFGNNMVLQRNAKINIWGKAEADKMVKLDFNGKSYEVVSNDQGSWTAVLDPMKEGGPYELKIYGKDTVKFSNIMVGDVWLCAGQSNMQFAMEKEKNAVEELPNAAIPLLRLFRVAEGNSIKPEDSCMTGGWFESNPDSVKKFSAVAYYFGKKLQNELKIPIGIIEAAFGGALVEAYTTADSLKQYPEFKGVLECLKQQKKIPTDSILNRIYEDTVAQWEKVVQNILIKEEPSDEIFLKNLKSKNWEKMNLPVGWEGTKVGQFDGVIWFKKNIKIPKGWTEKGVTLKLGNIDDMDVSYINGKKVGSKMQYNQKRVYTIPQKDITNNLTIAIKVVDVGGGGGLSGPSNEFYLVSGKDSVSLAGSWDYYIDGGLERFPERPTGAVSQLIPTSVYNKMIHPLIPYTLKGVVWYQGESNTSRPTRYYSYLKTLINSWRAAWNETLNFIIVQLPNYSQVPVLPSSQSSLASLRESQSKAANLKSVEITCNTDLGEAFDIHPTNKKPVAERVFLAALAKSYGRNIEYSGPRYKGIQILDNKVIVSFEHIGQGLVTLYNNELKGFAISGVDKKFYWAHAKINGDHIELSHLNVPNPIAVRYNWEDNPQGNLFNKEGLPAFPFRTDNWESKPEKLKIDPFIYFESLCK